MASLSFLSLPPLPKIRTNPNPTLSLLNSYNPSDSVSRFVLGPRSLKRRMMNRGGAVCYAAAFRPQTLQWVSAVSTAVLVFTKGTTIQKSFLVPLFALQAPATVISWIKGEYGVWTTFLALLVRLFYFIPGELDLPFLTMLLVIVAPYQAMNLRGSQAGLIISLVISAYLAFQHFSRAGSLRRSFDQMITFHASNDTLAIKFLVCSSFHH
ncbi:cold-regulated 413 inner membrane protein 1, chloroplastic-like isoform X3 [Asparagus officinalis]|uniref:cold-regulated 413 inner membrane protein 1, chloroplastic-like isoform X3 n=1 Tax=Asparagus officinalis TaxID=4686 RepID=UPI00098E551A|nr:cold-regulated 413 inner membrane protein 1, chloroplastic-like isoform X3 [Asparagus officinalis]